MERKNARTSRVPVALIMICLLTALSGTAVAAPPTIEDDKFDGTSPNTYLWTPRTIGTGPSWAQTNRRLEITIPAASVNDPVIPSVQAGYWFNLPIPGDFDARVGFSLLTWPTGNGVRVGFGSSKGGVERASYHSAEQAVLGLSGAEQYSADFVPSGASTYQSLIAFDTTGKLRLTRTNSASGNPTLTAYMMDASGAWIPYGSFTGPGAAGMFDFSISAWSHTTGSFGFMDTQIAFDDFWIKIEN